jgi:peptide deformylase
VAKGFNMHGDPVTIEGTELLARALQHETDHLNGILFIDRLSGEDRKIAMKEIRESDWFGLVEQTGIQPKIKVSPHSIFNQDNRGLGL